MRISQKKALVRGAVRRVPGSTPLALALTMTIALVATPALAAPAGVDDGPTPQQGAAGPRFSLGVLGSGATGQADGLERGHGFGAVFAAFFHPVLGVEVGYRRHGFDVLTTAGNELSGGGMDSDLVTAGVVLRVANDSAATPWVAGGIAWFRNAFEIDPAVRDPLVAFGFVPEEEVEDVVGFQVGGGVDVRVAPAVAVFGEARFLSASADTSATLTDSVSGVSTSRSGSQDVRTIGLSGGVRFVF